MNSLILTVFSRVFFVLMMAISLFIYYRGHNEPGGGFIGGLVAASGIAILALAEGIDEARRFVRIHPVVMMGLGLAAAVGSGVAGLLIDGSFLTHQWSMPGGVFISTTMIFDLGVYLVVVGGVLALVLRFYEEPDA